MPDLFLSNQKHFFPYAPNFFSALQVKKLPSSVKIFADCTSLKGMTDRASHTAYRHARCCTESKLFSVEIEIFRFLLVVEILFFVVRIKIGIQHFYVFLCFHYRPEILNRNKFFFPGVLFT